MIKKALIILLLTATGFFSVMAAPNPVVFNVKDYGAKGNGTALDSKAINKAIEAAVKAGGGTVYLSAGNYLSGAIRLKSNITLFLDQAAPSSLLPKIRKRLTIWRSQVSTPLSRIPATAIGTMV